MIIISCSCSECQSLVHVQNVFTCRRSGLKFLGVKGHDDCISFPKDSTKEVYIERSKEPMEQSEQRWHLGEDFLNSAFNMFKIFQIKLLKKGRRGLGTSQAHKADVDCHPIATPPLPGTKAPWKESPVERDGRDPSSEGLCISARLTGLPWWLNNKEST